MRGNGRIYELYMLSAVYLAENSRPPRVFPSNAFSGVALARPFQLVLACLGGLAADNSDMPYKNSFHIFVEHSTTYTHSVACFDVSASIVGITRSLQMCTRYEFFEENFDLPD